MVANCHVDALILRLAAARNGVVSRAQMLEAEVSRRAIDHRVRTGILRPLFRGTYAVGHPHPRAWLRAALLIAGPGSALSHATSTALLEMLPRARGPIHVTSPTHRRSRPGLVFHRATLSPSEVHTREGLDLTSPVRTLHDLAVTADEATLAKAIDGAQVKRLVTPAQLERSLGTCRPGSARLRAALDHRPGLTRSDAERRLVALLLRAQLPSPRTNARLAGYEVDVLYAEQRLIVEVDGYAFHSSPAAFERDRRRDADLLAAGYGTIRVTWRELNDRPEAVAARVATLLASRPLDERVSGAPAFPR